MTALNDDSRETNSGIPGMLRAVFAAGAQQLRECKCIGPKTADSIAAALDLRPTAYRQTKGPPAAQD